MKGDLARIRHLLQGIRRLNADLERQVSSAPVLEERDRFLDEIQSLAEMYLDLYDRAPDPFVSVDAATGIILKCNETVSAVLGYPREEIIGRPIFDMYHPDCMDAVREAFHEFQTTGKVNGAELQLRRKDGSKLEVILNVSAVLDSDGRILYSRSTWRDITERKRTEEEVHKLNMELEQRVRDRTAELEATVRELQQALQEVRTLRGLIPICAWCKKVRDDKQYWHSVESFVTARTEARFSHGMCPDCHAKVMKEESFEG
jgi:PAS domain S-box-containing protein